MNTSSYERFLDHDQHEDMTISVGATCQGRIWHTTFWAETIGAARTLPPSRFIFEVFI